MIENSYKAAMDRLAFSPNLEEDILKRLDASAPQKTSVKKAALPLSLAAGTAVLIGGALIFLSVTPSLFPPAQSELSMFSISSQPHGNTQELVHLTEDELFHKYDTLIFMGKITELYNISDNASIAKIKVENSYRGNIPVGNTIRILLPVSFNSNVGMEDSEFLCQMKTGMRGIFMPVSYQDGAAIQVNGEDPSVYYTFPDSRRFLFLERGQNILFDRTAYPSLKEATTLSQVETFIEKII